MLAQIPLQTIYFYVLIICAVISVLLFLFGDVFEFDGPVDPMLLVPWFAFAALVGYLGEMLTDWNSYFIIFLGVGISSILVFILNFYVLVPLRNSEATISVSERDLEGRKAEVVTPIPVDGMGEIKIVSVTGSMTRPAKFYEPQEEAIAAGKEVLIIEIRERVCYVVPYKENFVM
ncbi:NfeD family protein [Vagococcus acidifermentans]|uniref:Membrane protein NfeD2 N-terminal transmembrane domain-containing protein n=1 Tax=Vagococcus acidifermentans TaxID=564710 RepID=A0A430AWS1_9ENTE|nr:NfeD family protein [Vagococcus acidifermentans]RSU12512.1 hypothetical protein CBF27_05935 [Vagococcus acidifermentans]